jgi:hypothetical protein
MTSTTTPAGADATALVITLPDRASGTDPATANRRLLLFSVAMNVLVLLAIAAIAAIVALPLVAGPPLSWWLLCGFFGVMLAARAAAGLKEPTARPTAAATS